MSNLKNLKQTIDASISMKGLVEVYEEMAASTMRAIREAILGSRDYYHGLAHLSAEVGSDLGALPALGEKKEALVLLSSDQGMYGDIIDRVFVHFLREIKSSHTASVFVAGKTGAELMHILSPDTHFTLLPLPKLTDEVLPDLIKTLFAYKRVTVFFGQFENIVRQEPNTRTLTAGTLELTKEQWAGEVKIKLKYLYEPTIERIARVFSEEIFAGVFEQTFKEGELAKSASRLMHLDHALGTIDTTITLAQGKYRKGQKRIAGKKLHTQLSGYKMLQKARRMYV